MKITKSQLKQIIKEEVEIILHEAEPSSENEVIEENMRAAMVLALSTFLGMAAGGKMTAQDISTQAKQSVDSAIDINREVGKQYGIDLLKGLQANAENLPPNVVDLTAKKLRTVVGSDPDVLDALKAPAKPEDTGPGKVTGGGPAMSAVQFREELETLNEYDSKKIDKIAQVLQTHYSDSIPVVAKYLKTIDMLNNEFSREETPAANELHDALYNMGDIEQPIMFAVRQIMRNTE